MDQLASRSRRTCSDLGSSGPTCLWESRHHRDLTHGVSELEIPVGPGYRVYYTQKGNRLLILLAGGDKSSQKKDIRRAFELAKHV